MVSKICISKTPSCLCGCQKDRNIIPRDIQNRDLSVFETKQFDCMCAYIFVCEPCLVRNIYRIVTYVQGMIVIYRLRKGH